jgi:hypothetical protein
MDPIQEQLKKLKRTSTHQQPEIYGNTPTWRLKPIWDRENTNPEN